MKIGLGLSSEHWVHEYVLCKMSGEIRGKSGKAPKAKEIVTKLFSKVTLECG